MSVLNKGLKLVTFLSVFTLSAAPLMAQSAGGSSKGFIYGLIAVGVFLLAWAIIAITDNLMKIEANKAGIDSNENMGLFPSIKEMFAKKPPSFAKDDHYVRLKKGYDLKLEGEATGEVVPASGVTRFSLSPYNFRGLAPIPKVVVQAGDEVKAGDEIFFDKGNPTVKYVAPVSGEIVEVKRGAKRSISDIIILADKEQKFRKHDVPALDGITRENLVEFLAESGAWSLFNQRPFDIIPSLTDVPRDIFVSTFDTGPMAPDSNKVVAGNEAAFQKGIDVLNALTSGNVHVGINGNAKTPNPAFSGVKNAQKHYFAGVHPVGNVGIQIHHIKPIGIDDMVWTVTLEDVIVLGKLFIEGIFDTSKVVALTGAELKDPKYVKTYKGANIGELLQGNLDNDHIRFISGDVYSGAQKAKDEFMNYRDDQITVLEEGDEYEPIGWLLPITPRPSISNTYPNFLFPNFKFRANTNTHGERRAFVVTGQYEKVLPMDIYPQALMKSIVTEDLEKMEGLGITELSEEDIAICEFVCTSKAPMQKMLRDGLDLMRAQL